MTGREAAKFGRVFPDRSALYLEVAVVFLQSADRLRRNGRGQHSAYCGIGTSLGFRLLHPMDHARGNAPAGRRRRLLRVAAGVYFAVSFRTVGTATAVSPMVLLLQGPGNDRASPAPL
jgi:hypothetical protein